MPDENEPGNEPDPNTPRELRKARDDAKRYREEAERLRGDVEHKTKEADGLRGKLTQTQQDAETTLKAKLEELRTELTGKVTDAETRATQAADAARLRSIRADLRIAAKDAGMIDMDGLKLLDMDGVQLDEAGDVKNAAELMATLKKSKPFLFGQPSTGNPNPPPKPGENAPKKASEMTQAERTAAARKAGVRMTY